MNLRNIIKERRVDQMYLYKAVILYNPVKKGVFPNLDYDVKKYCHSFEISEIAVPEQENLRKLIDKFKASPF